MSIFLYKTKIKKYIYVLFLYITFICKCYSDQILYDDEVIDFFDNLTTPILKVSNLQGRGIKVQIILSNTINAYVIDNKNVYVYSGLISNIDNIEGLIGVIAHEIAHIKQSHILKFEENINLEKKKAIFSTILGLAIGISINKPGVVTIGALGGAEMAHLDILRHSRHNEYAADKLALDYLFKLGIQKKEMINFFKKLENRERICNFKNSYRLTHPLTSERIRFIESVNDKVILNKNSKYPNQSLINEFNIIKAKLFAITNSFTDTNKIYDCKEDYCLYANCIAYSKNKNFEKAIEIIDKLIKKNPNYIYYYITKAQLLFESGDISQSNYYYQMVTKKDPKLYISKYELANQLIIKRINIKKAIELLKEVIFHYSSVPEIWKKLGNAYYINKDYFEANKHYFKSSIIVGDKKLSEIFLKRSQKYAKTIEQKNQIILLEKKFSEMH